MFLALFALWSDLGSLKRMIGVAGAALSLIGICLCGGCASPAQTVGLTAGIITGTTLVGARSPGHELEQV